MPFSTLFAINAIFRFLSDLIENYRPYYFVTFVRDQICELVIVEVDGTCQ